jgi:hypothetical protein
LALVEKADHRVVDEPNRTAFLTAPGRFFGFVLQLFFLFSFSEADQSGIGELGLSDEATKGKGTKGRRGERRMTYEG